VLAFPQHCVEVSGELCTLAALQFRYLVSTFLGPSKCRYCCSTIGMELCLLTPGLLLCTAHSSSVTWKNCH